MVHIFKKRHTMDKLDGLAQFSGWKVFPSLEIKDGRIFKKDNKEIVFGKVGTGAYKIIMRKDGKVVHQDMQDKKKNAIFWAGEMMAFFEW
jgi:hypothetical protein